MQPNEQPAKGVVPSEDGENLCRTDMEAPLSDLMSTRGAKADKTKRWQQSDWGLIQKLDLQLKLREFWVGAWSWKWKGGPLWRA
ncbi:hypothetical protein CK203_113757 [Vitis vinifera]|uniref:Uncharacterized protein n=1 Tax=Vitis vinifera TaxID=29760 RepID=A0A438CPF4_VITVI|nr:hypothetical protein CK203_113757 [Vitis vinifera]